jgi:hypothetical protein
MDPNELTDELEEQAREREAEGEPAELAESGDAALTLDDLDSVAGGYGVRRKRRHIGPDAKRDDD